MLHPLRSAGSVPMRSNVDSSNLLVVARKCSTTSTEERVCMDDPKKQNGERRKRIRFGQVDPSKVSAAVEYSVPTNELWYEAHDYRKFKMAYMKSARLVARRHRSSANDTNQILSIFQACRDTTSSHPLIVAASISDQNNSSSSSWKYAATRLNEEYETEDENDTIVGLECMAARRIANDKFQRRKRLMRAVEDIQRTSSSSSCPPSSSDDRSDLLRMACERISLPSRRFSLFVARWVHDGALNSDS